MTIREQIATAAMQGLLSQHETVEYESSMLIEPAFESGNNKRLVRRAIIIADLLIEELEATNKEGNR